ncbi:MAG: HU family DNA-binding protein [Christensenellaceae bacterium]|jgi:DNA-binding protein HU-beta|nr:HU family DNA-binding protein [Christensenellaceae bacterium]
MTKHEFLKDISEKSGFTLKDSEKFLNTFLEVATKTLAKGENVALVGFGIFSRVERGARIARNFRTGKNIKVPPSKSVKFKVGTKLKDAVK